MGRKRGSNQQHQQQQQQQQQVQAAAAASQGNQDGQPYQRSGRNRQQNNQQQAQNAAPSTALQQKQPSELEPHIEPAFAKMKGDSWRAVLLTCLEFVMNDLRKRQKQFLMSMVTVMLTVSFITLVDCLCQLTPIPALKSTIAMSGDFDIVMMANTGRLKNIQGNTNFYTDENDFFNARHYTQSEKESKLVEQGFKSWAPFINYTDVADGIDQIYEKKGVEPPVGLFPRWYAQTKLENLSEGKFTSAYMVAGDSLHERKVGVAAGFPVRQLKRHEAITTTDVLSVLGISAGDQIQVSFDFFQMISRDFNKLKRLAYEYESLGHHASGASRQGEAILEFLKMPRGARVSLRELIGLEPIEKLQQNLIGPDFDQLQCIQGILKYIASDDSVRLAGLIEAVLPCTTPEIFTLHKNYTIVEGVDDNRGKWPNSLGNGWFTDSNFIVDDLIDMMVDTVTRQLQNKENGIEIVETAQELGQLLKQKDLGRYFNQYAMQIAGKFHNREDEYVTYGGESIIGRGKLRLMEVLSDFISHLQKHEFWKAAPFLEALEKIEVADFQVGSVLLTVVVFLFILDFIVIYTIMLSDVDERTYDFAMLRCLGFKNSSLVVLLLMQALLYSIPATCIGFVLLEIFTSAAQIWLYQFADISLSVSFHSSTYWLGLATGIGVPLLSNIIPIRKALGTTLRDALDKSRAGVNETEVQVVRLENQGVNKTQIGVGLAFLFVSFITLLMIPMRTFNVEMGKVYGWLNMLLILVIIGFIFTSQAFAPALSRFYLKMVIFFRPEDKLLLPLIQKNLESHGLKNMKANLMYTVALTYLVFSGTNFVQISNFMKQIFQVSFGAHFSLKSFNESATTRFDENKISQALETQLVSNGGVVESYTLVASTVATQFRSPGREVVAEQLLGIGLSAKKSTIKNLRFNAINEHMINTMMRDEVYFPSEIMDQPLGKGTRRYTFDDVGEMLFDMQPYSGYDAPFDAIGVLSGSPNRGKVIHGEVINMLVPQCFSGEIIHNIGDQFSYCVSSSSAKRDGDLRYAPDSCQVKFKARAVASFNKMPGFPKITGYKSALQLGGQMLAIDKQVAHIIDRTTDTFDEFAKTRELVVQDMPASKYNLLKETIYVRMQDEASKSDRLKVQNLMLANVEETQFMFWDMLSQFDDLDRRNTLVRFLHILTSMVCLILGAFQLVVTVSANISDSMWELGVLRSMGCTRRQITSIIVYELISTTMAAITLGYICGIIVSVLSIAIFHIIVELPMKVELPYNTLIQIFIFAIASMIAGAKYGTAILFKNNISQILKGC